MLYRSPPITFNLYRLGSYSEWVSEHHDMLSHVLPLLLQGLQDTRLAQAATLALKEIVRENQHHIAQFASEILAHSKASVKILSLLSIARKPRIYLDVRYPSTGVPTVEFRYIHTMLLNRVTMLTPHN